MLSVLIVSQIFAYDEIWDIFSVLRYILIKIPFVTHLQCITKGINLVIV